HTVHDLGGIVAHSDDGVRAHCGRVFQHQLKCFEARLFTQFSEETDVTADNGLQRTTNSSEDRTGADRDAPHDTERANHTTPIQLKSRGDHCVCQCGEGLIAEVFHSVAITLTYLHSRKYYS